MSRRIVQEQLNLMNVDFIKTMKLIQQQQLLSSGSSNDSSGDKQRADGDTAVEIEDFHEVRIRYFYSHISYNNNFKNKNRYIVFVY